jgi:hypothetical protein
MVKGETAPDRRKRADDMALEFKILGNEFKITAPVSTFNILIHLAYPSALAFIIMTLLAIDSDLKDMSQAVRQLSRASQLHACITSLPQEQRRMAFESREHFCASFR